MDRHLPHHTARNARFFIGVVNAAKMGILSAGLQHPAGTENKQSAASTATVHLDQDGNATTFHVHGGGLVISRMVNEFGIAKKVAATIAEAFTTHPAS